MHCIGRDHPHRASKHYSELDLPQNPPIATMYHNDWKSIEQTTAWPKCVHFWPTSSPRSTFFSQTQPLEATNVLCVRQRLLLTIPSQLVRLDLARPNYKKQLEATIYRHARHIHCRPFEGRHPDHARYEGPRPHIERTIPVANYQHCRGEKKQKTKKQKRMSAQKTCEGKWMGILTEPTNSKLPTNHTPIPCWSNGNTWQCIPLSPATMVN